MAYVESERLRALRDTGILDTAPEEGFDRLTALAATLFDAPVALVSLVDEHRQWFKSRFGLSATQTPRAWAFCDHAIRQTADTTFVVEDATKDERFCDNPLVVGESNVRFYAGAALTTASGLNIGTLCVIDQVPRDTPDPKDLNRLKVLARMVVDEVELFRARKSLHERGRLLELAEHMSGVGHWRLDIPQNRMTWSDEVYRIHGVDRATFDPSLDAGVEFYHEDDRDLVAGYVERAVNTGEDFAFQLRLRRADGEIRTVTCKATCQLDDKGAPAAMVGVFQDITDQIQTLQAVEESEARYRLLAENAIDLVMEIDAVGCLTYVSPAVSLIIGFTAEEVVGQPAMRFIHRDDRERVFQEFSLALERPKGWRIEYRLKRKDGGSVWIEGRPTVVCDEQGVPTGLTDVIRDISERKAAEEALANSENRYRLLADSATDIISQMTPTGEITFITPACRDVLGFEPEELIGRRVIELIHPDDLAVTRSYHQALRQSSGTLQEAVQFRAQHKCGHWVWLEGHPKIFFDDLSGEAIRLHDAVRDVTKRKEMETDLRSARAEAEKAAAVKAEFLANMSHELRTPLTSILGFAKLIGELELDGNGRRYLERISDASAVLLTTVNDILDFSKLETGHVEIQSRPTNLTKLISGSFELLSPQAEGKGIEIVLDCDGLPELVLTDDSRIRQILLNLISNAVKFTATGSVTVKARFDETAERLHCDVIDTGSGIPADSLERLFKRFSQVDASTTRSHGGTGLGLAICKGLAEAMGGDVGAASALGVGSTFWFEIPCRPAALAASAWAAVSDEAAPLELDGLRVMIADDNTVNRELVRIMLTPYGIQLSEAAGGREAIELAESEPFDVIIMDIRMPDIDGPSAATAIREGEGPNCDTPMIAFTAEADGRRLPAAWTAIFDDQLPKPINAADLIAAMHHWNPANPLDLAATIQHTG